MFNHVSGYINDQSVSGGVFQHTEKCTMTLNTKIWRLTDKLKAYVSSIKHAIIVLDHFISSSIFMFP